LDPAKDYVFDDVRFPNEASAIYLADGGALINIYRPGIQRGDHESEKYAGLMGENWNVANVDTPEYLFHQIDMVLDRSVAA
jgi:hypothetical protein